MKHLLATFLSTAFIAAVAPCVLADPVLPTLPPGTQYRVAFVTAGTTVATSTNIQDYHDFVAAEAGSEPILAALSTNWFAIAATNAAPMARTNSMTTGVGVPIYLLDGGALLVNDYNDLWDGSLGRPLQINQAGEPVPNRVVWTGSDFTGESTGAGGLGAFHPTTGNADATTPTWIDDYLADDNFFSHPMYAISDTLTAVPEPSAFLCLGLVGLGLVGWKTLKKSNTNS